MKKIVPVFIWLLFAIPCQAITITVDDDGPSDFDNIQAAIEDSNDGDIIEVQPGIYTGDGNRDIDFRGKAITVSSTDPNNPDIVAATIIDCNGTEEEPHRGFYFHTNEDANSIVDGLTITNGYASSSASYLERNGGAILCYNSNPTIVNCAIISNTARSGGGIYFYKCYGRIPNIISCTFVDNWAGFSGGGMASLDSSPVLNNCTFSGNFAGVLGGGIGHIDFGSPKLTKCRLIGNAATYLGGGMYGCSHITNCTITGNWAGEEGGGMNYCSGPITNCVITGNWAGYWGGGMAFCPGPVTNCTITGNWAGDHGGGLVFCSFSFANCIIWGNSNEQIYWPSLLSITYSDIQGGWPGQGNIDADPCFVEPGYWDPNETPEDANDDFWVEGDYHLLVDSPCIDAGDPNYPYDPNETDLDGRSRIFGNRIDMGVYEYSPTIQAEAKIVPRTINLASKGNWITCYVWLPEQYNVADIEPNSVILENEIQAASRSVDEQEQVAIARFSRKDIHRILDIGEVELTISGQLTDGTIFEARDTIKVIEKGGGKPVK
ncbi:MAG: choice-of-anchor Q domain-containing protein [Planctomycetota bacterium]|jgi:hypothetical protein